jgi:chromate transporter
VNRDAPMSGGADPAGRYQASLGTVLREWASILLTRALTEGWQFAVLAGAAVLLLVARRGVVLTLLAAGVTGLIVALAGGPLPR